ncbi:MAG: TonB-dependent receptor plug domain-containing protein [Terriglobia bacterium]
MCWIFTSASARFGKAQQAAPADLSQATLTQLMNVEVTSVSKKKQKLSRAAAAIYVITEEDIERSGATNIPDLLRMVPGLDVAQINANTWAVSSRGFNSEFADKMLVLIDGRTVYDPLFSGVFWIMQDLPLEDIERIEVIRGPGATIWGANAVNGVINIITKSSKETQGALVTTGAGTAEGGFGTAQYGGQIGRNATYRVYGKYFNHNSFVNSSGQHTADNWKMDRIGFRSDWDITKKDSLMVEGSGFAGNAGDLWKGVLSLSPFDFGTFNDLLTLNGQNLLGRWDHTLSDRSHTSVQMYFERNQLYNSSLALRRDTLDLEFQHHITLGERNDVVWGFGYRYNTFRTAAGERYAFNPNDLSTNLGSAFIQDEIEILPNSVWLTLGSKLEHNYYTGFEVEPSIRLLWQPTSRQTLWAAVSRATRTPSPADDSVRIGFDEFQGPEGLPGLAEVYGNPDFISEDLLAYELGYRAQASSKVSIDIATYYNVYDNLRGTVPGEPVVIPNPLSPYIFLPLEIKNNMFGRTYGAEASLDWQVTKRWTLHPGYAWFMGYLHTSQSVPGLPSIAVGIGDNPRHQFQIRSDLDLPHRFTFDTGLYYVDRLADQNIPAYTRADARLSWRVGNILEVSLVGQNLLDGQHLEFNGPEDLVLPTEIPRSVYLKTTWRF